MANERPHFSNMQLDLAERFQHAMHNSRIGGAIIRFAVGDDPEFYQQRMWLSQGINHAHITKTVTVPGDKNAGRLAKNWPGAMVMATPTKSYQDLKSRITVNPRTPGLQDALAYLVGGKPHIGISPLGEDIFTEMEIEEGHREMTTAMRVARTALTATMGLWLPSQRLFYGVDTLRVVDPLVPKSELPERYPGVRLG